MLKFLRPSRWSLTVGVFIFLLQSSIYPSWANTSLSLEVPPSPWTPCILRGISLDPKNPLRFDFIMDTGDASLPAEELNQESLKVVRYFLSALTLPKTDQWVNLSPTEKNRIAPANLSLTEMGRDMLTQDFVLKQVTCELTHPDSKLGHLFWQRVQAQTQKLLGYKHMPFTAYNRVWIVPDKAVVYEHGTMAYVGERHLKVMLEADYEALQKGTAQRLNPDQEASAQVVREILIPEIERAVNFDKRFATLRQIYNSMILAVWYKQRLRQGFLGQMYADQGKVSGIDMVQRETKEKIYNQYLENLQHGAYSLIREEMDDDAQMEVPRKYFSGGLKAVENVEVRQDGPGISPESRRGQLVVDTVDLTGVKRGSSALALPQTLRHPSPIKSAFEVGQRNNIGTFMPFQQVRSRQDWGVGDFGSMQLAVDVHAATGHSIMQVLPLTQSSADDSPYSVQSSLMFDIVYMSPNLVQQQFGSSRGQKYMVQHQSQIKALNLADEVDFKQSRELKREYLRAVWQDIKAQQIGRVRQFLQSMEYKDYGSMEDHILYGILKQKYMQDEAAQGVYWTRSRLWDWRLWDEGVRDRDPAAINQLKSQYREAIDFEAFMQMVAYDQLRQLRDYGREKGVTLMVDIPYALDGADIWLNPQVFGLKKETGYQALTKQGVPPEPAYKGGQYWQFFPYDWSNAATIPFILKRFALTQELTDSQRLDHVLGFYRQFRFVEDVNQQLTIEKLGLYDQLHQIQQQALAQGTDQAKNEAVKQAWQLIQQKFLSMRSSIPESLKATLPENAIRLLMDDQGHVYSNNLIQIARAVPVDNYAQVTAVAPWQRLYVAEGSVFNNQQKWDFIRLTSDATVNDQGFLYDYLFGEASGEVRATDSLRPAYFELSPGDEIMTKFLAQAQEEGTSLIWETLGVVPDQVQSSVDKLGGINYNAGIWGDEKYWGAKPNPYHYAHHLPNSYATLSLHDSTTERVRWEQEISTGVKEQLLNEWFGVGQWSSEDISTLTSKVQEKLLEKYIYATPSRMGVAAWVDLLGLGDDYRLNSPGKQGGQWRKRLPSDVTVEDLLAAAQGQPSSERANVAIGLMKNLVQIGDRQTPEIKVEVGTVLRVNPDVGGQLEQIRETNEPFLVDAYVQGMPQNLEVIVKDADGQVTAIPMATIVTDAETKKAMGIPTSVSKWSARFLLPRAGEYTFVVKTIGGQGKDILSPSGKLISVMAGTNLNPLSSDYLKAPALAKAWSVDDLSLTTEDLGRVVANFAQHMQRGLDRQTSSLAMLDSYLSNATGQEQGTYIALDWGGTNFRAMLVELKPGQKPKIKQMEKVKFTPQQKTGSREALLDVLVGQIQKLNLDPGQVYQLGLTMGFPIEQAGLAHGKLLRWNKAWDIPEMVGQDMVSVLQEALQARGVNNVKIVAVLNDTVGTQLTVPHADIGMILGTGFNFALLDQKVGQIINVESGAFDAVAQTAVDKEMLAELSPQSWHAIEKMVSGAYLGEVVRRSLRDLHRAGLWMRGENILSLEQQDSFSTTLVGQIEGAESLGEIQVLLQEDSVLGLDEVTIGSQDIRVVQSVVEQVSERAGALVAAGLIAAIQRNDPEIIQEHIVAVDGSVYEKHTNMPQYIHEAMVRLVGAQKADRIKMVLTKDGSGIGAAIAAAIAASSSLRSIDQSTRQKVGGIDLNPDQLMLTVNRDKQGVPLPFAEQSGGVIPVDGFRPVLIRSTPFPSSFSLEQPQN